MLVCPKANSFKSLTVTEFSTPLALVMCIIILFTAGFPVFTKGNWSTSRFISSYLYVYPTVEEPWVRQSAGYNTNLFPCLHRDIPLVITAFVLWKIIKRTRIVKLADIPLTEALERAAVDIEVEPELPFWRKLVGALWD